MIMIEKLGGRKFILTLFVTLCLTYLVAVGKLDTKTYTYFITLVLAVYGVVNTVSKYGN